jgi:hypothetical protein
MLWERLSNILTMLRISLGSNMQLTAGQSLGDVKCRMYYAYYKHGNNNKNNNNNIVYIGPPLWSSGQSS